MTLIIENVKEEFYLLLEDISKNLLLSNPNDINDL